MRKTRPSDRPRRLPPVVVEAGLGLAAVVVGLVGLELGWRVVRSLVGRWPGVDSSNGFAVAGPLESLVTAVLLIGLYGAVGLGIPYAYQVVRGFEERFLVRRPDRRDARWLAGLAALVLALVGVGTLLAEGFGATGGRWQVPGVVIGDPAGPLPQFVGGPGAVPVLLGVLVTAVALGVGVGGLFHGTLHRSLRRFGASAVAIGGTAAVLGLVFGRLADPVALLVVFAVAVAAGIAFERTENLVVPMAAYALLVAVALLASYALI